MDTKSEEKEQVGNKIRKDYPDKKYEMSEWCELPLTIDSTTIDSGIYMAQVIVDDLTKMNAVSWQSWTAVNGDGLLDRNADGELIADSATLYHTKTVFSVCKFAFQIIKHTNSKRFS
mgnify:CR=1 FL=1